MGEKVKLKGGIYGVEFGYHPKMGEYTALMLDIQGLSEIGNKSFNSSDFILEWKRICTSIRGESGIWRHSKGRIYHCHWI